MWITLPHLVWAVFSGEGSRHIQLSRGTPGGGAAGMGARAGEGKAEIEPTLSDILHSGPIE